MRLQRWDFADPSSVLGWQSVDDRVMGGVSRSDVRHDPEGHAVFAGVVSLEQGGGFASVRCPNLPLGDVGTKAYRLYVRGDGRRYKFALRVDSGLDGVQYQAAIGPPPGDWVEVTLRVEDFRPTWRGRIVSEAPPLRPEAVCQVGLLIGERQAGPFALAVRWIDCR